MQRTGLLTICSCLLLFLALQLLSYSRSFTPPSQPFLLHSQLQPCFEVGKSTPEPYTSQYDYHPEGVDLSGKVWADYHWQGNITRADYDDAVFRDPRELIRFKILDNELYMAGNNVKSQMKFMRNRIHTFIDSMIIALAWFKIPDVDFLADFAHYQQHSRVPSMVLSFRPPAGKHPGFAVPGPVAVWNALGPKQMRVMQECMEERYPLGEGRIPKAVWRGRWKRVQYIDTPRAQLVKAARTVKNMADVQFSGYEACSSNICMQELESHSTYQMRTVDEAKKIFPPGDPIDDDLFNQFAFVVDMDEIGFSPDFVKRLTGNTPILRQEAQFPEYYWSHLVADKVLTLFASDASDFVEKLKAEMNVWKQAPYNYQKERVERMQNFAQEHLSHFGVARATAYALTVYAQKIEWTPKLDPAFTKVSANRTLTSNLPYEFVQRVHKNS